MEFASYPDKDGYLKGRMVLKHGPVLPCAKHKVTGGSHTCKDCRYTPGTLLTYVPTVPNMHPRHGMIVAVHSGQVDVVWNPWQEGSGAGYGELRRRMGISLADSREEERRRRWDRKERRDALASARSTGNRGTLGP